MKIRALFLTLVLALSFGMSTDVFARNCKKGKPCGNSCISKNDVCHKEAGTAKNEAPMAEPAAAAVPTTDAAAAPGEAPVAKTKQCKKGKPCGNTCISMKATCNAG